MASIVRSIMTSCFPENSKNLSSAAYIVRHAISNVRYLRNSKNGTFKFGRDRDEVSIGSCNGINYVYFLGSDLNTDNIDKVVETFQEWYSNFQVYSKKNSKYFESFCIELLSSLPKTHRTNKTVFIGYSRGSYTMSAFTKYIRPCTAIYLAPPGDSLDARETVGKTFLFAHRLDPVYILSLKRPVRATRKKVFRGTMGMTQTDFIKQIHTNYLPWLKQIEKKTNPEDFCN